MAGQPPAGPPGWPTDSGRDDYGISFGVPPHAPGAVPPPPLPRTPGVAPLLGPAARGRVRSHPEGTTILVLGILSLVICPLIGPLAWSMGNKAMDEVRFSGFRFSNAGIIRAGRLLGVVSTGLILLWVLLFLAILSRDPEPQPGGRPAGTFRAAAVQVGSGPAR